MIYNPYFEKYQKLTPLSFDGPQAEDYPASQALFKLSNIHGSLVTMHK